MAISRALLVGLDLQSVEPKLCARSSFGSRVSDFEVSSRDEVDAQYDILEMVNLYPVILCGCDYMRVPQRF